eukprot:4495455-Prorocentrum_lima.AAC.1
MVTRPAALPPVSLAERGRDIRSQHGCGALASAASPGPLSWMRPPACMIVHTASACFSVTVAHPASSPTSAVITSMCAASA